MLQCTRRPRSAGSTGTMRMLSGSKALVSSDVPVLYIDEEVLVINKPSGLICDYDTKVQFIDSFQAGASC